MTQKTPKKTVSDVYQQLVDMVGEDRVIPLIVDNSMSKPVVDDKNAQ